MKEKLKVVYWIIVALAAAYVLYGQIERYKNNKIKQEKEINLIEELGIDRVPIDIKIFVDKEIIEITDVIILIEKNNQLIIVKYYPSIEKIILDFKVYEIMGYKESTEKVDL